MLLTTGADRARLLDDLIALAERSRAARRGVAAAIDADPDAPAWRSALALRCDEDDAGGTERLLRRARGADAAAQVRSNPIHRNEGFVCGHCATTVAKAPGGGVRNHCPVCLRSRHVDGPVPGDRASGCDGLMDPVGLDTTGGLAVVQRCRRCGHERRNGLHPEWAVMPDATSWA